MYFYIIATISILLPIIIKNKVLGLRISLLLLFILLGFQYQLVQDWGPNIGRWYVANEGASENVAASSLKMGTVYMWLLKFFKPITFFGWLMLSAFALLLVVYKYIIYYVPPKFYWVSIFYFILDVSYGPLYINSNRQTISIIFVLIGILFLLRYNKKKYRFALFNRTWIKYIIALLFFYLGAQCHSAAYFALLLIPAYLISKQFKGNNWLIIALICDGLLIARGFVNVTWLQSYTSIIASYLNIGDVDMYLEWMDTEQGYNSTLYMFIYCIIITLVCYYYKAMPKQLKFFSISWYFGFIIASYFTGNVNRLGEYFYIFFLFLFPNIVSYMVQSKNGTIKILRFYIFIILLGYGIGHSWTQMHSEYYEKWLDYKSVFDATKWE